MVYLFIFRRDLRVVDNTAWKACILDARRAGSPQQRVFPCFIFQEAQINPARNPYFSSNTVEFMIQSLHDLNTRQFPDAHQGAKSGENGPVHFFHSKKEGDLDVLSQLQKRFQKAGDPITAIYCNRDITPFAKKRDALIQAWCETHSIECKTYTDYNLLDDLAEQKPYQVYGAFWKRFGTSRSIRNPETLADLRTIPVSFATLPLPPHASSWIRSAKSLSHYYKDPNPNLAVQGGRGPALAILDRIRAKKQFIHYLSQREFPALDQGTTRLSAYLKYGCISIREAYHTIRITYGKDHGLLKELFWREFYDQIAIHFPRVLQGESLRQRYDHIRWNTDRTAFQAWTQGRTGFPIVDAAMQQLNTTGYMHNRMRMVVASFLVKDLFLDWRWGEKYFATKLVDYYPTANNGGWTFASGSGADAQQYNRIFNPWLQSEKYDKDAIYIKHWLPHLADVPAKHLHAWHQYHKHPTYPDYAKLNYPAPMVDHAKQAAETKQKYARVLYEKVSR